MEDEESRLKRHVKSLLNKLTIELFEKVATQLGQWIGKRNGSMTVEDIHLSFGCISIIIKLIVSVSSDDFVGDSLSIAKDETHIRIHVDELFLKVFNGIKSINPYHKLYT